LIALKARSSTLAHFRHFKLQTFGLHLIRDSVYIKIRHSIYELEHLVANISWFQLLKHLQTISCNINPKITDFFGELI